MILLIAYGNPLRRDDGAGLRLAEEMAGRWQEARVEPPGRVTGAVVVAALGSDGPSSPSLGHHTEPDVLLAYATLLLDGRPAPPAWLVTAPGVDFDHGEGLSAAASAAIQAAFSQHDQALMNLLESLQRLQ